MPSGRVTTSGSVDSNQHKVHPVNTAPVDVNYILLSYQVARPYSIAYAIAADHHPPLILPSATLSCPQLMQVKSQMPQATGRIA